MYKYYGILIYDPAGGFIDIIYGKKETVRWIDVCEEERIDKVNLAEALQLTNKLLEKHKNETTDRALKKVIDSLECAIQADTFWKIDIYLE